MKHASFKSIDIAFEEFSATTVEWFKKNTAPTYRDTVLKEHLYGVSDIVDDREDIGEVPVDVLSDLYKMKEFCDKEKASYIRFVP